jgi:hypothetical protein
MVNLACTSPCEPLPSETIPCSINVVLAKLFHHWLLSLKMQLFNKENRNIGVVVDQMAVGATVEA